MKKEKVQMEQSVEAITNKMTTLQMSKFEDQMKMQTLEAENH